MAAAMPPPKTTCSDCHDKYYYFSQEHCDAHQNDPLVRAAKNSHALFALKREGAGNVAYTTDGTHLLMTSNSIREGEFAIHDPACNQSEPHPVHAAYAQAEFKKGAPYDGSESRLINGHLFRALTKDDAGQVFIHAVSCQRHQASCARQNKQTSPSTETPLAPAPKRKQRPLRHLAADSSNPLSGNRPPLPDLNLGKSSFGLSQLPNTVRLPTSVSGHYMLASLPEGTPEQEASSASQSADSTPEGSPRTPTPSDEPTPPAAAAKALKGSTSPHEPPATPTGTPKTPTPPPAAAEALKGSTPPHKPPATLTGTPKTPTPPPAAAAEALKGSTPPHEPPATPTGTPKTPTPPPRAATPPPAPPAATAAVAAPRLLSPPPHMPPSNCRSCAQVAVVVATLALLIIGVLGATQVVVLPSAVSYLCIGFVATVLLLKAGHHLWSRASV